MTDSSTGKSNPPLVPLAGYVDRLSARPGDTLAFKVSSISDTPYTVQLVRSVCADPNPQPFYPGSYGIGQSAVSAQLDGTQTPITLSATIFSTQRCSRTQTVVSIGAVDLYLDEQSCVCLRVGDNQLSTNKPILLRHWYCIEANISANKISISHCPVGQMPALSSKPESESEFESSWKDHPVNEVALTGIPTIAARLVDGMATQHFNGKIENPLITIGERTLCKWDFSKRMSSTTVPATSGPDLHLVNYPARSIFTMMIFTILNGKQTSVLLCRWKCHQASM